MENFTVFHVREFHYGYGITYQLNNKVFRSVKQIKTTFSHEAKKKELQIGCIQDILDCSKENEIKDIAIELKGHVFGINFDLLESNGVHINYILDKTPIPHNGCRTPKQIKGYAKMIKR